MYKYRTFKKRDLYKLKSTINGFTIESRRIRAKEIKPKHLEEKEKRWNKKRSLGAFSRLHQLAYAYMLGKKYSDLEANRPLSTDKYLPLHYRINVSKEIVNICKLHGGYRAYHCKELDENTIDNWFKTDENIFKPLHELKEASKQLSKLKKLVVKLKSW